MAWSCASCGGDNPAGTRFCGHCGAPLDPAAAFPRGPEADLATALRSFVTEQVADKLIQTGGELSEERRLVTALFADLSGFTPLADRLDPEELLEVIDPIIEKMTDIVGRYEGYVDKFAGDALLAFFGAPTSHEDDAARALHVAIEMHKGLQRMLPDLPAEAHHLTLHVGVNTGHVVARVLGTEVKMDYAVLGDAVILAQRLESVAPPGETYVGQVTHFLTRDQFRFSPVGELTLKGKQEPVVAWRLEGHRGATTSQLPSLVGRQEELTRFGELLTTLSNGTGAVLTMSGEPGVGKSRLAAEFQALTEEQGGRWMNARCLSYGQDIPYWPYADLVRRVARIDPQDEPQRSASMLGSSLAEIGASAQEPFVARMLGLPAPELDSYSPEDLRRELHVQFGEVMAALCSTRPLVLVLDDLQWADASSLDLTSLLTAVTRDNPFIVLATGRPDAGERLRVLRSAVPPASAYDIVLEPLGQAAVEDLLGTLLDGDVPERLAALVKERASGNPFFATEIVRSLIDAGTLAKDDGRWLLAADEGDPLIPPTVEGVLSARMDLLPPSAAATLQLAAVIGRRTRTPLLLAAAKDARRVEQDVLVLIEGGFLDAPRGISSNEVVFHHALMQDVAYSRLLRKKRRELHLKVAAAAESLYGGDDDSIDLLARHLYLGQAGEKAISYLVRAGERSRRLFANEEAVLHFDRATELARKHDDDVSRLCDLLLDTAHLEELRGNYERALVLYTEARDKSRSLRAWRGIASVLRNQAEYASALEAVETALNNWEGADAAPLWLEKGWTLSRLARFDEAMDALRTGLEICATDDTETRADLLLQISRAQTVTGQVEEGLQQALAARSSFQASANLRGEVTASRIAGEAYTRLGLFSEAVELLTSALELARKAGIAEEVGGCLINLGFAELERGAFESAIKYNTQAATHFRHLGAQTGQAIAGGNLASTFLAAGRLEEAFEAAQEAMAIATRIEDNETIADVTETLAHIHSGRGDHALAAMTAESAAEMYLEMGARPSAIEALEAAARACESNGDASRARALSARAQTLLQSS